MDSPITPLVSSPTLPAALPTFVTDIALKSLDNFVISTRLVRLLARARP